MLDQEKKIESTMCAETKNRLAALARMTDTNFTEIVLKVINWTMNDEERILFIDFIFCRRIESEDVN